MSRVVGSLLVLALAVPALAAAGQTKEKPAATPAEQYQALVKIYQDAMQAYSEAIGKAETYDERMKVFDEVYPKPEKLAPRFLELAEKYPRDPVAFDALTWIVVNCVRTPARIPARVKAVAILSQDHVRSEKLGPICQNVASGFDEETASLLTAVLDKTPAKTCRPKPAWRWCSNTAGDWRSPSDCTLIRKLAVALSGPTAKMPSRG
jgi:hypothetical protein